MPMSILVITCILSPCFMFQEASAWSSGVVGGGVHSRMMRSRDAAATRTLQQLIKKKQTITTSLQMSYIPPLPEPPSLSSSSSSVISDMTSNIIPFNPEIFSHIQSSTLLSVAKYLEPDEPLPPLWLPSLEDKVYLFLKTPAPYIRQYNPPVGNAIYDFAASTASGIDIVVMNAIKAYVKSNAILAGSDVFVWYREEVVYKLGASVATLLSKLVDPKWGYIVYDYAAKVSTAPPVVLMGGSLVLLGGLLWVWNGITTNPQKMEEEIAEMVAEMKVVEDDDLKKEEIEDVIQKEEVTSSSPKKGVLEEVMKFMDKTENEVEKEIIEKIQDVTTATTDGATSTALTTTAASTTMPSLSGDEEIFEEMKQTLSKLQLEVDAIQTNNGDSSVSPSFTLPIIDASVSSMTKDAAITDVTTTTTDQQKQQQEEYDDEVLSNLEINSDIFSKELLPSLPSSTSTQSSSYTDKLASAIQILQDLSNDISLNERLATNRRVASARKILDKLELNDYYDDGINNVMEQQQQQQQQNNGVSSVGGEPSSSTGKALPSSEHTSDFEMFLKTHTKTKVKN